MELIGNGIKGYNFPIANYINEGFELIPIWKYFVRVICGIFAFVLFITCLMITLSIYAKTKLSLLANTVLVMIVLKDLIFIMPLTYVRKKQNVNK